MDDLLSVNNKNFKIILQEIYPMEAITIEPTFLETLDIENEKFVTKTTYLNLEISLVTPFLGVNNIKYTWKRDKLPIIPCEFVKRKVIDFCGLSQYSTRNVSSYCLFIK